MFSVRNKLKFYILFRGEGLGSIPGQSFDFCGGQNGTRTGFCLSTSYFSWVIPPVLQISNTTIIKRTTVWSQATFEESNAVWILGTIGQKSTKGVQK